MRDIPFQTPQKDFSLTNRRTKSVVDHQKKLKNVPKKSLISEFCAFVEDASAVVNSPKVSLDFSALSELSEETQLVESAENLIALASSASSPVSQAAASSGLTSLSTTTSDDHKVCNALETPQFATTKPRCIEAEFVINHLKLAQHQVLNTGDMDSQSKRLLDALIHTIIEDLHGIPEEKEHFNEHNFSKVYILVCLFFLLWILAVSVIILNFSDRKLAFRGATPT